MPWRDQLNQQFAQRQRDNLWRSHTTLEGPQDRVVNVNGQDVLNFCSNDYLGLATHPALANAAMDAIQQSGNSSSASHLVCGHLSDHERLESELAQFVGAEQAVVFSTGYMANLAIPQTFLGRDDLILEDRLNHASMIDAGLACSATMKRYSHVDVEALIVKLKKSDAARKMVLTDGVFSMDGDQAPVRELKNVCREYGAVLVVDDAHGFGVLGNRGSGLLEQEDLRPAGNILMVGTLGKAAGSFGAFIAGDAVYMEALIQFARTYIYTTALPPSVVATTRAAIEVITNEPERRASLRANVEHFKTRLQNANFELMESQTPIQPILLGNSNSALAASQWLWENGIWVSAIRPPTVPEGSARLRITLTANHQAADIDRLCDVLTSDAMTKIVGAS